MYGTVALQAPDITLTSFRNKLKSFLFNVHAAHLQLATLRYINVLNNSNNLNVRVGFVRVKNCELFEL